MREINFNRNKVVLAPKHCGINYFMRTTEYEVVPIYSICFHLKCQWPPKKLGTMDLSSTVFKVAGAGFEPTTSGL